MKFAQYYNVTKRVTELVIEGKMESYDGSHLGVYICEDTHDFWICRILEGYNEEYELEEGKWLVERNKIDKFDVIQFAMENEKLEEFEVLDRHARDIAVDMLEDKDLIDIVILMDDENGLENWDLVECDSLEECVDSIDGGYGIVEEWR